MKNNNLFNLFRKQDKNNLPNKLYQRNQKMNHLINNLHLSYKIQIFNNNNQFIHNNSIKVAQNSCKKVLNLMKTLIPMISCNNF